ncbi:MAG: anti-phage defense protein ZorA [Phenylobacterium sp.]|uniref:anti-phage ZorAB system protein ZorA n=1 Tax=Phenylobacterium sp. TaxID=1871053 RepID=UPI0025EE907D|nr:anti-phage ZorAB system protein ZorA [Phenylobacterium sp.]MCA3752038.1 anti-phage defense protein ZorA [Phenylobacterium sp.]MCA6242429.1 anti-phage defense protein ZorA [Phenylobacterium sp.]MCA6278982.1 anti-phage defense protein ZorA [Phenylobacterium sp.]MCA6282071.1 anti-phage defense protein ZorA [Phenylobacterium sp.]MCA6295670.1 anti-phage defense protein ZorA [Phenylobacterium sp.]
MEDVLNGILHRILYVVSLAYTHEWFVPFVLLPIMLVVAGILHTRARRETAPFVTAATARIDALKAALGGSGDPLEERHRFAEGFLTLSEVMGREAPGSYALVQAWREFQESFVDENADPIRNTSRPGAFFSRVAPRLSYLTFASNIFVGVGLILTFFGLIVALGQAAQGMSGNDVAAAKGALAQLLTVAGAKFFTSVGGLACSIWLRFVDHNLSGRSRRLGEQISGLLERGLLYVPPQRLAVEQLEVLKEQRDELKIFNTDFAMQLGDRIGAQFQQALAPMTSSITQMVDSMSEMTSGIGDGARKAIEEVSGDQLRGLSEVLATLGLKIEAISTAVGSSGDEAARQIRDAGSDFAKAAADIRGAFDRLASQVDGMGDKLQTQSEAAARAQDETLQRVLQELSAAQSKSADAIEQAVEGLKAAGLEAAATMQNEVQMALATGVAEGQKALTSAIEESGGELRATVLGLAKAVGDAADAVEHASGGFVRSGDSAARSAETLSGVTGTASALVASLESVSERFQSVTAPVVRASEAMNDAMSKIQEAIRAGRTADVQALDQMKKLTEQMKDTHQAAEKAWNDYHRRFAEVDKALAVAAERMASTLGDSLSQFSTFATKTDTALADAVGKLSGALSPIEDYAESLSEYVDLQRSGSTRAAE